MGGHRRAAEAAAGRHRRRGAHGGAHCPPHRHPHARKVFAALPAPRHALEQGRLELELEAELVQDPYAEVLRALAANPGLGSHGVARLAKDPLDEIRSAVALRPDLTEEQRAAVRYHFDPKLGSHTLPWVADLHGDAVAMRRLAASSHPLIRHSVARARHLPPDVVERLARDEDRVVRLFLSESCDGVPADLLLEVWRWWDGSLSHPDRPRSHHNFPRKGLLCYADDPSGRMRRMALNDPESTPADVARLARDPEAEVRCRAAKDPRLQPDDAVRLLNDPADYIRRMAMCNPRLPARVLARLLHDRDTASVAVTNPAIPVPGLPHPGRGIRRLNTDTPHGDRGELTPNAGTHEPIAPSSSDWPCAGNDDSNSTTPSSRWPAASSAGGAARRPNHDLVTSSTRVDDG
ncbi:hypothetical protein [Streptomyces sp. NBC_00859]|uniref:hypothetical protein n=1 Tax=Streptomyces sp. NBC_00859 TaxID=2903682 RepID=UPI003865FD5A|nr:hypothetical protein OG584_02745 [Streptomyces sp. NBC_00859]